MTSVEHRGKCVAEGPWIRLDRLFDKWMRTQPMFRLPGARAAGDDVIRVDEHREDGTQVIRAELPGIDPDRDVQLTVNDGALRIDAEHRTARNIDVKSPRRSRSGSRSHTAE